MSKRSSSSSSSSSRAGSARSKKKQKTDGGGDDDLDSHVSAGLPSLAVGSFDPFALPLLKARELESGTREWIVKELEQQAVGKRACVLLANAGMGKSVIMAAFARRSSEQMAGTFGGQVDLSVNLVAMHFFNSADKVGAASLDTCFPSLDWRIFLGKHSYPSPPTT